jgi:hypothetical protein
LDRRLGGPQSRSECGGKESKEQENYVTKNDSVYRRLLVFCSVWTGHVDRKGESEKIFVWKLGTGRMIMKTVI